MMNRCVSTLDDRKGITRRIFTSNPKAVYVELAADCAERYAVRMTPQGSFDHDSDYLLEVTDNCDGTVSFRNFYGTAPEWATVDTDWSLAESEHGANLIASPQGSTFKPGF
mgnify:CR=1 FL=1